MLILLKNYKSLINTRVPETGCLVSTLEGLTKFDPKSVGYCDFDFSDCYLTKENFCIVVGICAGFLGEHPGIKVRSIKMSCKDDLPENSKDFLVELIEALPNTDQFTGLIDVNLTRDGRDTVENAMIARQAKGGIDFKDFTFTARLEWSLA